METEDGCLWLKHLAYYIRTHEKALANTLHQRQAPRNTGHFKDSTSSSGVRPSTTPSSTGSTGGLVSALTFGLASSSIKPAKLGLTPNQLYYLLSRFEELGVAIGPMNVRMESLSSDTTPGEYVSFLSQATRPKGRSADQDSLHSVSSVRSVVSSMSSMWSNLSISSNSAAKEEKRKAVECEDLKYLYSACTKIPALRLVLDHRTRRIQGYEEFPFDTAVPLWAFKNLSVLEIINLDFRSFYGWDRLAEQLRSLTIKRGSLDDLSDLLVNIVLDDIDKRRKRSAKAPSSPAVPFGSPSPARRHARLARSRTDPDAPSGLRPSPTDRSIDESAQSGSAAGSRPSTRLDLTGTSPSRSSGRIGSAYLPPKYGSRARRSSSSSSNNARHTPRTSSTNLLSPGGLSPSKWRFLRHLCIADNGLTSNSIQSLQPLVHTLHSLDLSSNLFTEIPDTLALLTSLRALNLANCMIESLHSLARNPLPAITVLNLRGNRLRSLAGIEKLLSLERIDLRENRLADPSEVARLTGMPDLREIHIAKNPFTKTHPIHRTIIFNLFRQISGSTDDILIDGTHPGFTERKHLVDRAPERQEVPVVRPPAEEEVVTSPQVDIIATNLHTDDPARDPDSPQTPAKTSSAKPGRKTARRRIVDLSESPRTPRSTNSYDASPDAAFVTAQQTLDSAARRRQGGGYGETPCRVGEPHLNGLDAKSVHPAAPTAPGQAEVRPAARQDISLSGEQYRKRIEALKQEYGSSWLSALGNESSDPFSARETTASPGAMT